MSPFAILLRDLRVFCGLRQAEFAEKIGVEQSYVSALEVGAKGPPGEDFVPRLVNAFELDSTWSDRLREALDQSQRKMELPKGASVEAYAIFNGLRKQINHLHPAQIELIEYALKLPEVIKMHETNQRVIRAASQKEEEQGL